MSGLLSHFHHKTTGKDSDLLVQFPFSNLNKEVAFEELRQDQLVEIAQEWDPTIRALLKALAKAKWAKKYWLGFFPVSGTRIRREWSPQKVTWWVEHDIPPYDRYRCEAYFVEMELDESLNPVIMVRSAFQLLLLQGPNLGSLKKTLARVAKDLPVIIPRRMGAAHD